jgi:F0F1-type ATP synthase membrane subunit b/b'
MKIARMFGIGLLSAVLAAVSVVWYIDYKIDQAAEAVMAPVRQAADQLSETADGIRDRVTDASEAVAEAGDEVRATIDRSRSEAEDRVTVRLERARVDVTYELENARRGVDRFGDWLESLSS